VDGGCRQSHTQRQAAQQVSQASRSMLLSDGGPVDIATFRGWFANAGELAKATVYLCRPQQLIVTHTLQHWGGRVIRTKGGRRKGDPPKRSTPTLRAAGAVNSAHHHPHRRDSSHDQRRVPGCIRRRIENSPSNVAPRLRSKGIVWDKREQLPELPTPKVPRFRDLENASFHLLEKSRRGGDQSLC
jgi:hypothetical protein